MNKKTIYLAHSVHSRSYGKGIQKLLENMDFEVLNPFYPKIPRKDISDLDNGVTTPWKITDKKHAERIRDEDLKQVAQSDILVILFPEGPTIGIPCEMMFAWMMRKIIISLVPSKLKGHPWILANSTELFEDLDSLINYLEKLENEKN